MPLGHQEVALACVCVVGFDDDGPSPVRASVIPPPCIAGEDNTSGDRGELLPCPEDKTVVRNAGKRLALEPDP